MPLNKENKTVTETLVFNETIIVLFIIWSTMMFLMFYNPKTGVFYFQPALQVADVHLTPSIKVLMQFCCVLHRK